MKTASFSEREGWERLLATGKEGWGESCELQVRRRLGKVARYRGKDAWRWLLAKEKVGEGA